MVGGNIGDVSYMDKTTNDWQDLYAGIQDADAVMSKIWKDRAKAEGYLIDDPISTGFVTLQVEDCTVRFEKFGDKNTGRLDIVNSDVDKRQRAFEKLEVLLSD